MSRALELRDLVAGYDGVPAVRGLSMHVDEGEVVALLGPNGAGKTTTLYTIAGVLKKIDGEIDVLGAPVRSASSHSIARRGLALLPEDRGIFFQLTVDEDLRLNRHRQSSVARDQVLEYFPLLAPPRRSQGRPAFGRRAADAGSGLQAHRRSATADGRRDEHGSGPDHR